MGLTYIASVTASASATLSFTTGIDATYNEYQFHMVNIHPATDLSEFLFQVNAAGATGFNETITSTFFWAYHNEADSAALLAYEGALDQAQGTAYQYLQNNIGNAADEATSGILTLYAPSSTTYVKHFTSRMNAGQGTGYSVDTHIAGYINTTSAIDEISFKFSAGNIDDGTIKMFGVS